MGASIGLSACVTSSTCASLSDTIGTTVGGTYTGSAARTTGTATTKTTARNGTTALTMALATYASTFGGYYAPKAQANVKAGVTADVTIDVGFADMSLGGRMDNLAINGNAEPDEWEIDATTFGSDGTYTTGLTLDSSSCAPSCPTISFAEIDGQFFGEAAGETGGIITTEGVSSGGNDFVLQGAYSGAQ